jgi:hypothetical protein
MRFIRILTDIKIGFSGITNGHPDAGGAANANGLLKKSREGMTRAKGLASPVFEPESAI